MTENSNQDFLPQDPNAESPQPQLAQEEETVEDQNISAVQILDAPRDLPEPVDLSKARLKEIQNELAIVKLCWPDVKEPNFEDRVNFPESYTSNSNKEKLLLLYSENFRRQFLQVFTDRKALFLAAENEVGLMVRRRKIFCKIIVW